MKIERTKNATRSMAFGFALKIYQIFVQFLLRTAMIYFMGVEYLGLNSLFTSVLDVLNLAELGVGSAMVFAMYKPIAEDDTAVICALMRLYRLYYRVIGGVIAAAGILLTPFVPYLIKSDLPPELNVYALYLLNLGATVLSYWLFAYKNALFAAHQRLDMESRISLFANTVKCALQFIVIFFIKDYYLYVIITLFTQAMTNVLTAIAASRMYPAYKPRGKLAPETVRGINRRIRDLFAVKLAVAVTSSADTVVISAFLGLTALALYQNYYIIYSGVYAFFIIVYNSCKAGIGNSLVAETKEKNFHDLNKFTFLVMWLGGFCTCCLLCLYQPFMEIWVGRDLMLDFSIVILFSLYFFSFAVDQLLNVYKDAAGMWHNDRFRLFACVITNVVLNLITVQFWGIFGVILSTIITILCVGMPWLLRNLFVEIFDRAWLGGYLKQLGKYTAVVLLSCACCYGVCSLLALSGWGALIVNAVVCCVVPNAIYFVIYRKTPEFKDCLRLVDQMTKNKLGLEKRFG